MLLNTDKYPRFYLMHSLVGRSLAQRLASSDWMKREAVSNFLFLWQLNHGCSSSPSKSNQILFPLLLHLRLFILNRTSGVLSVREGAPVGSYRLQVRVSEPVWPDVTCTAQVDVLELQPKALQSSASLRLSSESPPRGTARLPSSCRPLSSASSCFLQT